MTAGLDPTETTSGGITVITLDDSGDRSWIPCASFDEAIQITREKIEEKTVVKIENRDESIVFTSGEMDIDDWVTEWRHAKASLGVDRDTHECPYDSVGCIGDDLCVQCKMDLVQNQYTNE